MLLAALVLASTAAGADGWARIKTGMTPDEAVAALGAPLLRTSNRGYQLWIYSDRAEVVFFRGPVVAWTAPIVNLAASKRPIGKDVSVLPGGIILRSRPVGPQSVLDQAYAAVPESRFRYNPRLPRF